MCYQIYKIYFHTPYIRIFFLVSYSEYGYFLIIMLLSKYIIRRYCVIVYAGHFLPLNFCLISVRSLPYNPKFLTFYADIFLFIIHCANSVRGRVPLGCIQSISHDSAHEIHGRGRGHSGANFFCTSVRAKLFWLTIYCAKPRPVPKSQTDSQSCRGVVRLYPRIMR